MILIFLIYLSERFSHPKAKITQRPQILLLGFTRQSLSHSPRPSRERERENAREGGELPRQGAIP